MPELKLNNEGEHPFDFYYLDLSWQILKATIITTCLIVEGVPVNVIEKALDPVLGEYNARLFCKNLTREFGNHKN